MIEKTAEQIAFEMFAKAHPHEAHEQYPDLFWEFFHRERPEIDRETMERLLKETAETT